LRITSDCIFAKKIEYKIYYNRNYYVKRKLKIRKIQDLTGVIGVIVAKRHIHHWRRCTSDSCQNSSGLFVKKQLKRYDMIRYDKKSLT